MDGASGRITHRCAQHGHLLRVKLRNYLMGVISDEEYQDGASGRGVPSLPLTSMTSVGSKDKTQGCGQ